MCCLIAIVCLAQANDYSIEVETLGIVNGRYSVTYNKYVNEALSINGRLQLWNAEYSPISKLVAYTDASVSDASVYLGTSYFPFKQHRKLFGSIGLEMGVANITIEKNFKLDSDSTHTSGIFLSPTLTWGYRYVTKRGLAITPQMGLLYNISFIDYSRIQKWPAWHEGLTWEIRWDDLNNIRKGIRFQLGLKVGLHR